MKSEVDKLDINKLTNVPTSLNNLTVAVDLKKLSHIVDNEVAKNPKFNTLKTKVSSFGKKILDATTLIYINQYNTDKLNLEKKIGDIEKKNIRYKWLSDYNCFQYQN